MDHNEIARKFEAIVEQDALQAQAPAVELEALVPQLPDAARQLARLQVKTSHKQARDFLAVGKQAKES